MGHDDESERIEQLGELRARAEAIGEGRPSSSGDAPDEASARLIQELETHQIELELQNEELRKAQVELAEAHSRYLDLYDFAPVGYATLDGKGTLLELNLRLTEMVREPRDRLIGRPLSELIAPEDQDEYFTSLRKVVAEKGRRTSEHRLKRSDEAPLWVRADWVFVEGEGGRAPRVRVTWSDITESRRSLVQLAQNDRMSSLGVLAAAIGHELNNPLTYVLYSLESLAEELPEAAKHLASLHLALGLSERPEAESLEDRVREMVDLVGIAVEGAHRIRESVRQLRVFSSTDDAAGVKPLKMSAVLTSAIELARDRVKPRARVLTSFEDDPKVIGNEGRLSQVFLNLLVNAAEAIEEGDAEKNTVRLSLLAKGDQVLVEVTDTGRGIPRANLEAIFDPFFTTKAVGTSSGLGLSICRKIVESLGGRIWAESEPGEGSRVLVRLPIEPEGVASSVVARSRAESGEAEALSRGRVLVVDSEPELGRLIAKALRRHDVTVLGSGLEGRDALEAGADFDVILYDLMTPELTGVDLLEWLESERPELVDRVVFLTGAAFSVRARRLLNEVSNIQIEKPFSVKSLKALVDKLVLVERARALGQTLSEEEPAPEE